MTKLLIVVSEAIALPMQEETPLFDKKFEEF
ncbi:hypothetical protein FHS78_003804 [Parvibaculum indicum]|nr:hypothetical protein [Parvibaculum indicum]